MHLLGASIALVIVFIIQVKRGTGIRGSKIRYYKAPCLEKIV
jgi:hypothetical protein